MKTGSVCTKANQTASSSGYKYTCIKSGKKLVWGLEGKIASTVSHSKPTSTPTPTSTLAAPSTGPSTLFPGLVQEHYSGYFSDDPNWFTAHQSDAPHSISSRINRTTNGKIFYYSMQWIGYFVPTEDGVWSFKTTSDDASYLWLGKSALGSVDLADAKINLSGIHGPVSGETKLTLVKGRKYPFRLQYGNNTNWDQMDLLVAPPGGSYSFDLFPYVEHAEDASNSDFGFNNSVNQNYVTALESTSSTASLPQTSSVSDFLNPATCKLADPYQSQTGFGFPKSPNRLPSSGTIRAVMFFVDFNDDKGTDDPLASSKNFIDGFKTFYSAASYGKANFAFDIYPKYIHINTDSSKYGMQTHNGGNPLPYFQDALQAAAGSINFSNYQDVYVIPPTDIQQIVYGPSFPFTPNNNSLVTPTGTVYNGAVAASDWRNSPHAWVWMAHETGHLFGMEHPYNTPQTPPYTIVNASPWDLMYGMNANTPDFLAWSKWRQGWLDDTQVRCLDASQISRNPMVSLISPIERASTANKMVVIKINATQAITIESRRNEGADHVSASQEGVLVHIVDVSKLSNQGAYTIVEPADTPVIPGITALPAGTLQALNSMEEFPQSRGQGGDRSTVSVDGLKIIVLFSDTSGDYVSVTRS